MRGPWGALRRGLGRVGVLQPLAERDFALLTAGSFVSQLGDGFFFVALAWQVYDISNVPTAMSVVGLAWTLPLILFVLVGGVFSDRYDRRWLMVGADLIRAAAIGLMGILSMAGVLEIWHIILLIAVVGIGDAFFNPASTAIVPDLVAEPLLPQANALGSLVRPLTGRLIGPAIGGFTVALVGSGAAFLVDGASFLVSAVFIAAIRHRPRAHAVEHGVRQALSEIGEGLAYVRSKPWIWATLVSSMLSLLVFVGPEEVLLPFLVRNRLELGADALGLIFAVGGVGAVVMAVVVGQTGLPRRTITAMFVSWTVGVLMIAGFGLMTELWHALVLSALSAALFEFGAIIWYTLLQRLVPRDLLGRVSSLDWLVSIGLVPLSFALTGPIAGIIGPETTLVVGGVLGSLAMVSLLFFPGVRDPEHRVDEGREESVPPG
ncbi:MAG TPA: MFS transporter [Candidatus Limnocylindria bacterium]|nr:MFS transporter [Candidatus Limnocylindria bacterium]